jgi:hypothetical protein
LMVLSITSCIPARGGQQVNTPPLTAHVADALAAERSS